MAIIVPDFSETQDQVEAGSYSCRIVEGVLEEWPAKDDRGPLPYVKWTLETFNETDSKNNGRRILHKTPIVGKGAFRLQLFYKAAMGQDLGGEFDSEMLLGKELKVTVVDGMDKQGNPTGYPEVKAVAPLA